jgi:DNA (cytosine-5)-methyltransferase 1
MRVLDLFSGIGGFSLGLQKTGYFNTLLFCEIEDYCQKVLSKNFPDIPIHSDVRSLSVREGEYDLMCGGFPCQDISIAIRNKSVGIKGERSGLWFQYKRLIAEGRPKYVIIENVHALLSRGLSQILLDLAEIGYDATWTTFDSKYFGVPQRRRRVYIIAVREGIPADADIFEFGERDNAQLRSKMEIVNNQFAHNFAEKSTGRQLSYFTFQRSDSYSECGLSNTLAKRDHKSATDLVLDDGYLRRVNPRERLRLQGFPDDWFDGCSLSYVQQFKCNGMTVPVVEHIGKLIKRFDDARSL